jgi:hypothetical protein
VTVDDREAVTFPRGTRLVTDLEGKPVQIIGMVPRRASGTLAWDNRSCEVSLDGNQVARIVNGSLELREQSESIPKVVYPTT